MSFKPLKLLCDSSIHVKRNTGKHPLLLIGFTRINGLRLKPLILLAFCVDNFVVAFMKKCSERSSFGIWGFGWHQNNSFDVQEHNPTTCVNDLN